MLRALVRTRVPRRHFADKVPTPPKTTIIPPKTTATSTSTSTTSSATASSPTGASSSTASAAPKIPASTKLPPPKPRPGIVRRLGRLGTRLVLLSAAGFGGGVLYSRYNDNFHDFFTEYVPFAEQALLYLEENDFRKRYGEVPSHRSPQAHDTTVPSVGGSGVSWRVADAESGGRTSSAVKKGEEKKTPPKVEAKLAAPKSEVKVEAKPEPKVEVKSEPKPASKSEIKIEAKAEPKPKPQSERIRQTQLLDLPDAKEPIVQDVVHLLNDLITVINADNEQWKYAGAIARAKERMGSLGDKIRQVRASTQAKAGEQTRVQIDAIDKDVNALVNRFDQAVVAKEQQWREELSAELEQVRDGYEKKVQLLLARERQAYDQRLKAQLDAQAVALKRELQGQVQEHVEREREGRLSRLEELSSAVESLEKLASSWSDIVDGNLRTQQLHVALEAVRSRMHDAEPRGFVRELAALKLVAEDPIVDAAIASIPPAAYQQGVPTAAALVDRFRRVATEVRKAALLPEDAGLASHVGSWALSKVLFKRDGAVVGVARDGADDVEGVLAKTQMLLEEGDLDGAAREMNGLSGWAKALSKDWLGEVRKVLELRQALDVIATEARLESLKMEAARA